MIGTRRVIAIIAGRGGSKGLPRKNVAPCAGRPLVAWSVAAAKGARHVDLTIVSSDSEEILAAGREAGADPWMRPAALATDEAGMDQVVLDALDAHAGHDVGVLLQATSPLRTSADIDAALETMVAAGATSVVSVTPSPKSPYWMFHLREGGALAPLFPDVFSDLRRRQELAPTYVLNGAVYAFDVAWFRRERRFVAEGTVAHIMPAERSVDIDTAIDLRLADLLLREAHAT